MLKLMVLIVNSTKHLRKNHIHSIQTFVLEKTRCYLFYKTSVILSQNYPKPDKDDIRKENYGPPSWPPELSSRILLFVNHPVFCIL